MNPTNIFSIQQEDLKRLTRSSKTPSLSMWWSTPRLIEATCLVLQSAHSGICALGWPETSCWPKLNLWVRIQRTRSPHRERQICHQWAQRSGLGLLLELGSRNRAVFQVLQLAACIPQQALAAHHCPAELTNKKIANYFSFLDGQYYHQQTYIKGVILEKINRILSQ